MIFNRTQRLGESVVVPYLFGFTVPEMTAAVTFVSSAQTPELAPGLYTVVWEDYVPLKSVYGTVCMSGRNVMGYETNSASFRYKKETSGTDASETGTVSESAKEIQ